MKRTSSLRVALYVLLVTALGACSTMDKNIVAMDEQVAPITVGDSGDVPADVLAAAMMRAGFTSDQILRKGPDVHDALATSGGAQVRDGDSVLALFAVHDGVVYVTSRTAGTFQLAMSSSAMSTAT